MKLAVRLGGVALVWASSAMAQGVPAEPGPLLIVDGASFIGSMQALDSVRTVRFAVDTARHVARFAPDGMLRDGEVLRAPIAEADIQSVEVLKGAAAAQMYGTRASAGVIVIRTKGTVRTGR